MFIGMGKIGYERLQQAIKRKGTDNALEAKKKKLGETSLSISYESTPTAGSSRSLVLVKTPALAPAPSMTIPTRSSKAIQRISPASPTMSSGIA